MTNEEAYRAHCEKRPVIWHGERYFMRGLRITPPDTATADLVSERRERVKLIHSEGFVEWLSKHMELNGVSVDELHLAEENLQ